ncbi:MAG: DNA-3-methyladenine glycosylase, partial [Gemmatimonadaceae bacterium]
LVRAVEPVSGIALMRGRRGDKPKAIDLTNGPGKLCEALGINGSHNGVALQRKPLAIREGRSFGASEIETTPRIGISRAVDWPLRYLVRGNPYVSRFPRARVMDSRS